MDKEIENTDITLNEKTYGYLDSSYKKINNFSKKTSVILSQMVHENEEIMIHAKNIMEMNDKLIDENNKLISENTELREILNGVNNLIYVTCPYCKTDKNVVSGTDVNDDNILKTLILGKECYATCDMCGNIYKVFNGRKKIESSKLD